MSSTYERVMAEYRDRQETNHAAEMERHQHARSLSPRIAKLLDERHSAVFGAVQACFGGRRGSPTGETLPERMERLNQEIRAELAAAGLPEDYLQPRYQCPDCQDSGYVLTEDGPRTQCECLRRRLAEAAMVPQSPVERTDGGWKITFETFRLDIFPDEPVSGQKYPQREWMSRARNLAETYAAEFPANAKPNLLLTGPTGTGKTYLGQCIAAAVEARGYTVRSLASYRLVELMRKYHFDGSGADAVTDIYDCALLVLDDLGTEPMIRNVTVGYLYQILNERGNAGRHTIISTNLKPGELAETYTERVASRLLDKGATTVLQFFGRDLRTIRREP